MKALRLLPPLAWTALIGWFSTDRWSGASTSEQFGPLLAALLPWASPELLDALHWLARKAGHVTEYAVLAGLWAGALGGWRWPLALSVVTAFLDELHQSATLSREGSAADVLLDSASAVGVLALARAGLEVALVRVTSALLWIAGAGGVMLLALNVAAGAPSGQLWLVTPIAWLALWFRRRSAKRGG